MKFIIIYKISEDIQVYTSIRDERNAYLFQMHSLINIIVNRYMTHSGDSLEFFQDEGEDEVRRRIQSGTWSLT